MRIVENGGLDACPECGHDLWLHASGDLETAQHCRFKVEERILRGAGKYGGDVYQSTRCKCRYLIDKETQDET